MRILITGSRDWSDGGTINQAILEHTKGLHPDTVTVVHGDARGADELAGYAASTYGFHVETHPADRSAHGKAAGPIRNQKMVDLGADICLAFPKGISAGTFDCAQRAQGAGIPVKHYREQA